MPSVGQLITVCERAYDLFPRDCSGAVLYVLTHMQASTASDPPLPPRTANEMMHFFADPANGWRKVASLAEALAIANKGGVVVGGKGDAPRHGHVLVVMPGKMQNSGFWDGRQQFPSHGLFPPAMSTSSYGDRWVGAMSRGEKTVRDAFTTSDWPDVTFWTREP